ncbi:MAG: twin-arginine translocase TatA/TatE family subunit [bacterium TMED198]|nr:MAG: twin-arginine translocase TatA/TatE family subunit [bacterium TMED198]|tara:strand:- start:10279 stop:10488 length:210 start_codon:yes stop_codon:yes gene_type:complete
MFGLSPVELLVILFVVLVLFGGKKLPELARGLGKGFKEFKKAQKEIQDEINEDDSGSKQKDKNKEETSS